MIAKALQLVTDRSCSKCGGPLTGKQGNRRCKPCWNAYMKEWRLKNLKRAREIDREWREKNPEKFREGRLKALYNIDLATYSELLNEQNGVCAICGWGEIQIDGRTGKVHNLAVDHDHDTGHVRGLLCAKCNQGIGVFRESAELLKIAIKYLQER